MMRGVFIGTSNAVALMLTIPIIGWAINRPKAWDCSSHLRQRTVISSSLWSKVSCTRSSPPTRASKTSPLPNRSGPTYSAVSELVHPSGGYTTRLLSLGISRTSYSNQSVARFYPIANRVRHAAATLWSQPRSGHSWASGDGCPTHCDVAPLSAQVNGGGHSAGA